jgi:hypothetical protein
MNSASTSATHEGVKTSEQSCMRLGRCSTCLLSSRGPLGLPLLSQCLQRTTLARRRIGKDSSLRRRFLARHE